MPSANDSGANHAGVPDPLPFAEFERVSRSLADAGAPFLIDGAWFPKYGTVGPPVWRGFFVVVSHPDAVLRAVAALVGLGYRTQFAVDFERYADPDNLPKSAEQFRDDSPSDLGIIKFLSGEDGGPVVQMLVCEPEAFAVVHEHGFTEEVTPGVPVHHSLPAGLEAAKRQYLDEDCPQSLPDVAILSAWWCGELEECVGSFLRRIRAARQDSRPSGQAEMRMVEDLHDALRDDGLSLVRYSALVAAMSRTGTRFIMDGHWTYEAGDRAPLGWYGWLHIGEGQEPARRTFAALGELGYAPEVEITAEEFGDPRLALRLVRRGIESTDGTRLMHFEHPDRPEAPINLGALPAAEFERDWEIAELDYLAPGLRVSVLNVFTNPALSPPERGANCAQHLVEVAHFDRLLNERGSDGLEEAMRHGLLRWVAAEHGHR
jgi:hypothetical protein